MASLCIWQRRDSSGAPMPHGSARQGCSSSTRCLVRSRASKAVSCEGSRKSRHGRFQPNDYCRQSWLRSYWATSRKSAQRFRTLGLLGQIHGYHPATLDPMPRVRGYTSSYGGVGPSQAAAWASAVVTGGFGRTAQHSSDASRDYRPSRNALRGQRDARSSQQMAPPAAPRPAGADRLSGAQDGALGRRRLG
jgi:hypothetical protein